VAVWSRHVYYLTTYPPKGEKEKVFMNDPKVRRENVDLRLRPGFGFRGKRSFSLVLPANSSTGYSWTQREQYVPSIIEATHRYTQHQGPPGTGGTDEWTFTATAVGDEIVKLAYAPDADPDDVSEWVEIHFKVTQFNKKSSWLQGHL